MLLVETLGSRLRQFATLSNPAYNEIEVLVEKRNNQFALHMDGRAQ